MPIEDAQDAVQSFLAHIRAGNLTQGTGPSRDRLRSFLLSAFGDYVSRKYDPAGKSRRGNTGTQLLREFSGAESWLQSHPPMEDTPEMTFRRAWARSVLSQSCAVLKGELAARHGDQVAEMIAAEVFPTERRSFNVELAPRLGITPSEVLHILRESRRRLRELILETLRETVSSSSEVELEFWDLFKSIQ